MSQPKVVLFTREIHKVLGGMERQLLLLAKELHKKGMAVTVVSLDLEPPTPFYDEDFKHINFVSIASNNPKFTASNMERIGRQFRLFLFLRKENPDLGIAFMTGSYFYSRLPTLINRIPLVLAERNSPAIYLLTSARRRRYVYFFSMLFADTITVQFPRYREFYPKILQRKIVAIPNYISRTEIVSQPPQSGTRFLAAGRFSFQKQFLLLIRAFALFAKEDPECTLTIVGSGEEYEAMIELIIDQNLSDRIFIKAPTNDLKELFSGQDVLCIPSIWEGFPNILAEALAAGIPALGFMDCDGVSDLIQDGVNGWKGGQHNDLSSLVELLRRANKDIRSGKQFKSSSQASMREYEDSKITLLWLKTFNLD